MIQSISFQNFRGFKNLELPELAPITLLSGKNNAGKSTVLEGLFLLVDHSDPMCFGKICNFRNLSAIPDFDILWKPLFYQLNADESIRISAHLEHDIELTYYREDSYSPLPQDFTWMTPEAMNRFISSAQNGYTLGFQFTQKEISYTETGHFIVASPDGTVLNMNTSLPNNQKTSMPLTRVINSQIATIPPVELFGKLELDGRKSEILDILRKMDQALSDITTITVGGQTQLYGNMGGKLLPMRLVGDGVNRLLFIMLSIMENPNAIILIDEIENGFHYSMYPVIWEAIANAAQKSNCQVIATTHSYECVAGAVEGIEKADMKDQFCFFRLAQEKKGRVAYRYSEDLLQYALESNVEVR
ncbi:AAA family ATPase [Oscillospiraceae bacterium 44-5]